MAVKHGSACVDGFRGVRMMYVLQICRKWDRSTPFELSGYASSYSISFKHNVLDVEIISCMKSYRPTKGLIGVTVP